MKIFFIHLIYRVLAGAVSLLLFLPVAAGPVEDLKKDLIFSPRPTISVDEEKPVRSLLDEKCILAAVKPASTIRYGDVDAVFTIKNITHEVWEPGEVEFVLTDGKDLLKYPERGMYVSDKQAEYGKLVTGTFDIIAPSQKGNYLLTAEVYRNDELYCTVSNVLCVW